MWVLKCGYAAAYVHSFYMLYCVERHVDMCISWTVTNSVFVCFIWISEQTAIISVYTINCSIFIKETGVITARYGLNLKYSSYFSFFLDG
jgi:hypothetical protein